MGTKITTITTYVCDRCETEMVGELPRRYSEVSRYQYGVDWAGVGWGHNSEILLCDKCDESFQNWLDAGKTRKET